jgi:ubiquinone/menaquinone biosynthesis C-methylase UbiE
MPGHRVCPWWIDLLGTPFRRLIQDPAAIVTPYVHTGMTVLEPGPGMGFFTLELARLVGPSGRIIAVDIQPQMIAGLQRRARKAGLIDRIDARVAPPTSMGLDDTAGAIDFAFVFAVLHEMPAAGPFFTEAARALRPGATLLLAEPAGHVDEPEFRGELAAATQAGLDVVSHPPIDKCRTALLCRPAA